MLAYNLDSEPSSSLHVRLILSDSQGRQLSADKLPTYAQKQEERQAIEWMIREEKRFVGDRPSTFPIYRVRVLSAFAFLKILGTTGRLLWQGKKIVIDPFTEVTIDVCVEAEQGIALVEGKWRTSLHEGPLSDCSALFPEWLIKQGTLYPLKDTCDSAWIALIFPRGSTFQGQEAIGFLHAIQTEKFPPLSSLTKKGEMPLSAPLPFLVLLDKHGGFADLWFTYEGFGKIAAHDPHTPLWRDKAQEEAWERDLLESGFHKKCVEASHYYCPLDKVSPTLRFLLDVGWTLYDNRGRQVLGCQKEEITPKVSETHILLLGTLHYAEERVDVCAAITAMNRQERFVDISPHAVGLLDAPFLEKMQPFAEHEVIEGAIAVKKYRVGQLAPFFSEELPEESGVLWRALPEGWSYPETIALAAFRGELFPYQREGVQWLEFLRAGRCGGLLADEMGLGKTVQIVAFFSQLILQKPCLIVVPTSLLFNWTREFAQFSPSAPLCFYTGKEGVPTAPTILLTSYALLRLYAERFQQIDYQVVVLDEAQTIKNPDSQIAQVAFSLKSDMRLAVTGTPIENRLQDLWSLFRFLSPELLGARFLFQAAGVDPEQMQQVKRKIRPFFLRREKKSVALQLPPKMEQIVWVDMSEEQRALYERWLQQARAGLIEKVSQDGVKPHRMEILETILRLRQLCVHPWLVASSGEGEFFSLSGKCQRLFYDLEELAYDGKKVLIYSQFTTMLHLIRREVANKGWRYVYLDGETTDREAVVRQFQEEKEVFLFLISLKAGGVGLNLTAADYVFLFDPWWNVAVEEQAIDRAHRVGKTSSVIARRYVTALSIEEKIMRLKEHKQSLSQGLFTEGDAISLEEWMQLLLH